MKKGFILPLVLILVLFFSIPLGFLLLSLKPKESSNVKGASTQESSMGFYVLINSNSSTWELSQYLCKTKEECTESLQSGTKYGSINGGKTQNYKVVINSNPFWSQYSYIKLYVRSGWSEGNKGFKISSIGNVPSSSIEKVSLDNVNYESVLIPLDKLNEGFFESAVFTDL